MKNFIFILVLIIICVFSCNTAKQRKSGLGKIWPNERIGAVKNRSILDSLLSETTRSQIDSSKSLILIYYPGKDKCNSSGMSTRKSTRSWYNEMERGIRRITKSNLLYIYRDTTGLYGRHDGYKKWYKDPERTIEKLFFKVKPKCGGYVLISKKGEYISLGSEFDKKFLWKRLEYLINNEN